jgi:amino acid transporter/mannitol/fructose-specific phosphotransferase system IIA component (Ntr-type)
MAENNLTKSMGFLDVFALAAGAMISSGIFVLPGIAFSMAGPAAIFSYLLAGLLMIPTVLAKAELTTAMPRAGGTYFYIERSLGIFAGTLSGFANWFSIALKSAFALVGMGAFLEIFYPNISYSNIRLLAVALTVVFTLMNMYTVKGVTRMQVTLVGVMLAAMFLYCIFGFRSVIPDRYSPFFPERWQSVFAVTGMVFISFGGLTKISSVGEEIRNPRRNVLWGMLVALLVVTALYVFIVDITVGLVPAGVLRGSLIPLVEGSRGLYGTPTLIKPALVMVCLSALMAFFTTANAGILAASRVPLAMSRDAILPAWFQKMNRRSLPVVSILFTAGFMILAILVLRIENLVKLASTLMIFLFLLDNLAVIMMRESRIPDYRPLYWTPFYPWMQLACVGFYGFLIFQMGYYVALELAAFLFICFVWYLLHARRRVVRVTALTHIVHRIISPDKELVGDTLGDELKEILWVRDEITQDRFDGLVRTAKILDLQEPMDRESFFRLAAGEISGEVGMTPEDIYQALEKRENEISTMVGHGFAIPHIIVPHEDVFSILIARARQGVRFASDKPPAKTIFLLAGSRNERNFYLRALMAIAEIAHNEKFEEKWERSRGPEDLRNLILFSARRRSV